MQSVEVKIRKLDAELMRYKDQMSKLRNGPGKVRLTHHQTFVSVFTRTSECHRTESTENSETEKNV